VGRRGALCVVWDEGREGGMNCAMHCEAGRGGHGAVGLVVSNVGTWKEDSEEQECQGESSLSLLFHSLCTHHTTTITGTTTARPSHLFVRPAGIARMPKVSACLKKGRRSSEREEARSCAAARPANAFPLTHPSLPTKHHRHNAARRAAT